MSCTVARIQASGYGLSMPMVWGVDHWGPLAHIACAIPVPRIVQPGALPGCATATIRPAGEWGHNSAAGCTRGRGR